MANFSSSSHFEFSLYHNQYHFLFWWRSINDAITISSNPCIWSFWVIASIGTPTVTIFEKGIRPGFCWCRSIRLAAKFSSEPTIDYIKLQNNAWLTLDKNLHNLNINGIFLSLYTFRDTFAVRGHITVSNVAISTRTTFRMIFNHYGRI